MSEKRLPDDPAQFEQYFRERAAGHAPGYDLAIYLRPHQMIALADRLRATAQRSKPREAEWQDDPAADERWNAGCDYALEQLCHFLGVDKSAPCWDAATETVDGDVRAIIGNIMREKFGDDWGPELPPAPSPHEGGCWSDEQITSAIVRALADKLDISEDVKFELYGSSNFHDIAAEALLQLERYHPRACPQKASSVLDRASYNAGLEAAADHVDFRAKTWGESLAANMHSECGMPLQEECEDIAQGIRKLKLDPPRSQEVGEGK